MASRSAAINSGESALRFSGRLRVICAIPSATLKRINVNLHAQQCGAEGFSLRIGAERNRAAAAEALVQQESSAHRDWGIRSARLCRNKLP
jgi:hypothetical protein